MQIKIYALINPLDNSAFYVGATQGSLTSRRSAKGNISKERTISFIKSRGASHEIMLLDEVQHSEAEFWEQFYMNLFRSWGFNLANVRKSDYGSRHASVIDIIEKEIY